MKENEEQKRTFLVNKYMQTMVSNSLRKYTVKCNKDSSIEELREAKNLYCSIKNGALLETLRKQGIVGKWTNEVKAKDGETIFSISVENLDGRLYEFSDYSELPETCNISVEKHIVFKD